jgi:hypothetical protein
MQPVALLPVPFSSLRKLIATASRFCGRQAALLKVRNVRRPIDIGDVLRLALLAPELRFPIDVNAQILSYAPGLLQVRYTLADHAQIECALGQLYSHSEARLPVSLEVKTAGKRACRLAELSSEGATFEVLGELSPSACAPDSDAWLQLPHEEGRLNLAARVAWVTPRRGRSRMHVSFARVTAAAQRRVDEIVCRFRLGDAPWTPKLLAPGV